jgi:hypothetical protein
MAIQLTSSRKKPAAKANVANAHLIDRLRHIKAQPIDLKVLAAIVGKRTLTAKEATEMEKQINALLAAAERVQRTRRDLEQMPSLIQRGSVLL